LSSCLLFRNVKVKTYKTIILPAVLYGCKTWSLTLRDEHRLRVFENTVLRGIFGRKRDEVTGQWRKLNNGELHNLYSSPDIIRQIKSSRMRSAGHTARMGEGRKWYKVLVRRFDEKTSVIRPRRKWKDGIKMDVGETGCVGVEWIHLAQNWDRWRAVVNTGMNLRVLAPRSQTVFGIQSSGGLSVQQNTMKRDPHPDPKACNQFGRKTTARGTMRLSGLSPTCLRSS
jgi:hypothetical protein